MRDFCVESTAIHEEYVREYNKNILPLAEKLNDVDFYCVTTHPDLVIKKDNIIPIDISVFTNDEFSKSYDHESGFCNILQSTRYGLKAALDNGYVKVIHLHTDFTFVDKVTSDLLSQHFRPGIYFDMGGTTLHNTFKKCQKTKFLVKEYKMLPDIEKIGIGDDPVVLFKFKDIEQFQTFYNNLEEICEKTFEHQSFSTGLCAELVVAMHITGVKSYYNYSSPAHSNLNKFFDVAHNHLHVEYYSDRDPDMKDLRKVNAQNI
tara:strand:+ start:17 stop:799 length:783 start_codon:yes stop_codon:yes gene_type:complete